MSYIFYSFSNGTKENGKKEALLFHSYIKRNLVPRLPRGPLRACISANLFLSTFYFSDQELRGAARRWLHKQWCLQNSF